MGKIRQASIDFLIGLGRIVWMANRFFKLFPRDIQLTYRLGVGATAFAILSHVRFQAFAKMSYTADMRRKADK